MRKSINPIWGGRFKNVNSELLKKINNSISFDYQLAYQDVKLNKVYVDALYRANILSKLEKNKIIKALDKIYEELKKGKFKFSDAYEDIHMNIEMSLKEKIGELAGKIHTGKSRNDQVATDLKMWVKDKLAELVKQIISLQKAIIKRQKKILMLLCLVLHTYKMHNLFYFLIICYLF